MIMEFKKLVGLLMSTAHTAFLKLTIGNSKFKYAYFGVVIG